MLVFFGILIIIVSVVLGLIILVQNPKGGGLSSSFGGFGNQIMGVKQTTDVLERGTWLFAGIIGILCLASPAFIPKGAGKNSANEELRQGLSTKPQNTAPAATTAPMPGTASPDTNK